MDNDNKIVPKKSTTGLFLDDLDIKAVSEKDEYILKEEFTASKKNRSWRILIILVLMAVVLGGGSWGISRWIEARNVIKDYELDEFQDVDLMDVLNQVRKVELALEEAERQLVLLRREYQNARQAILDAFEQEMKILEGRDLSQSDRDAGIGEIAVKRDTGLQAVDDEYLEKIALKEEEIRVLREQMSAYDAEKVQQAQEYEAVIANEKQKFELEKQQLIDSYEVQLATQEADFMARLEELSGFQNDLESVLKNTSQGRQSRLFLLYNPVITENMKELYGLTERSVDEDRFAYNFANPDPVWFERGYLNRRELAYLNRNIRDWRSLMEFMEDIPFENSVPDVLDQLEYRYLSLIDQMSLSQLGLFENLYETETALEETSAALTDTKSALSRTEEDLDDIRSELRAERRETRDLSASLDAMDEEFAEITGELDKYSDFYDWFSYSMTLRLRDLGGQGILMEPGLDGKLLAFIDPFLDVPSGASGYIFGIDNEYIGQISLEKEDLFYRGEILHKEEDRHFNAFDRIFLKVSSLAEEGSDE